MEQLTLTVSGVLVLLPNYSCVISNSASSTGPVDLGPGVVSVAAGASSSLQMMCAPYRRQISVSSAGGPASITGVLEGTTVQNLSSYPLVLNGGTICQPGALLIV